MKNIHVLKENIYITSDEEIKYDEYYLGEDNNIYCLVTTVNHNGKKIILTTDQDLIKDGVQAIDDVFLEWIRKNPSCEEVEVVKIEDELISPKNPKIRFNALQDPPSFISAESLNNMILTYKYKIIIPKEESKQETLEEATEIFVNNRFTKQICGDEHYPDILASKSSIVESHILFAKWQQEQILQFLYSEITERRPYSSSKMCEKVIEFIEQLNTKK